MDKRLKLAIIILSAVLLALGTLALVLVLTDGEKSTPMPESSDSMELPVQSSSTQPSDSIGEEKPPESSQEDALIPQSSSQEGEVSDPLEPAEPTTGTNPTQKPTEAEKDISFPYTIPGTSLVITKIDSYDGIFLEDGSDRSVTGICALVLTNSGKTDVEYADITVQQGNRELLFKTTVLRAGCTVVVQEANAAAYASGAYQQCTAQVAEAEKLEMSADQVKVTENQDGSFTVTNLTDKTIGGIRIFYKFCLTEGSVYVGGITYTAKVENLAPGATQTVFPTHYSFGSSEVVMVRLYDSLN